MALIERQVLAAIVRLREAQLKDELGPPVKEELHRACNLLVGQVRR